MQVNCAVSVKPETNLVMISRFTRGWTLQELIAPRDIIFFDAAYNSRGTKRSLTTLLSHITRIDRQLLRHERPLSSYSVAQKMSWASQRETTRIEDEAYSLLGLFNLNMPLLYGEEEKAFLRLQEEIIRTTVDLSIFAWVARLDSVKITDYRRPADFEQANRYLCGMLAVSPQEFSDCHDLVSYEGDVREFSTSNFGIKTALRLMYMGVTRSEEISLHSFLPLNCKKELDHLGIYIRQVGRDKFLRQDPHNLATYNPSHASWLGLKERRFLTQIPKQYIHSCSRFEYDSDILPRVRSSAVQITIRPGLSVKVGWPSAQWDMVDGIFFQGGDSHQDFCFASVTLQRLFCEKNNLPFQAAPVARVCALMASSKGLPEAAEFGILEEKRYGAKLNEIRKFWHEDDTLAVNVAEQLRKHKIPKSNVVIYDPVGSGPVVVLGITVQHVQDPKIATGNVWKLHISRQILDREKAPFEQNQSWNFR